MSRWGQFQENYQPTKSFLRTNNLPLGRNHLPVKIHNVVSKYVRTIESKTGTQWILLIAQTKPTFSTGRAVVRLLWIRLRHDPQKTQVQPVNDHVLNVDTLFYLSFCEQLEHPAFKFPANWGVCVSFGHPVFNFDILFFCLNM